MYTIRALVALVNVAPYCSLKSQWILFSLEPEFYIKSLHLNFATILLI